VEIEKKSAIDFYIKLSTARFSLAVLLIKKTFMKLLKHTRIIASIILLMFTVCSMAEKPVQNVCIQLPSNSGPISTCASEILSREITERSNVSIVTNGKAALTVELIVNPGIGTEGFKISDGENGSICITGND
jgi:hypothetical protein